MSSIVPYLNGGRSFFDSTVTAIMEDAFRRACRSITATSSVKTIIDETIFELTKAGECSPHKLCHETLAHLQMKGDCE